MWQLIGKFGVGWGSFLTLTSGVLLLVEDRGSPEFVVSGYTFAMGLVMLIGGSVWLWVVNRNPGDRFGPRDRTPPGGRR